MKQGHWNRQVLWRLMVPFLVLGCRKVEATTSCDEGEVESLPAK